MADARQQADWDRTLSLMAFVGSMLGKEPPRPVDLVPARYRPRAAKPPVRTEAELDVESKAAWQLMHQFFRGGHHNGR